MISEMNIHVLLCVVVTLCNAKSLSDYITTCSDKLNDQELNKCIKDQCNIMIPKLKHGDKEMKILPIAPFEVTKIDINIGTMHLELVNGKVYGLHAAKIEKVIFDREAHSFYCEGYVPHVSLNSDYQASGKLLILPIEGTGPFEILIEEANFNMTIKLENFERGSKDKIKFVSTVFDYVYKYGKIKFDNLFKGNKELSEPINKLINEEHQSINNKFKQVFIKTFNAFLQSIVKPIFDDHYYKDFFSE